MHLARLASIQRITTQVLHCFWSNKVDSPLEWHLIILYTTAWRPILCCACSICEIRTLGRFDTVGKYSTVNNLRAKQNTVSDLYAQHSKCQTWSTLLIDPLTHQNSNRSPKGPTRKKVPLITDSTAVQPPTHTHPIALHIVPDHITNRPSPNNSPYSISPAPSRTPSTRKRKPLHQESQDRPRPRTWAWMPRPRA